MEWYWIIVYVAAIWIAVFITPLGMPGPLFITGAAALAGWSSRWTIAQLWMIVVFLVLAVVAEILEHLLTAAAARSHGATRAGLWGSILGGVFGALIGLPIPLMGSIFGAFAGAFLGAVLAELLISRKEMREACRAGYGAFRGRVGAVLLKTILALSMAVSAMLFLWTGRS